MICGRTCLTWALEPLQTDNVEWQPTEGTKQANLTVRDLEDHKVQEDHRDLEPHRDPLARLPNSPVNCPVVQTKDPAFSLPETSTANANSRTHAPLVQLDLPERLVSVDFQEYPEKTEFPDRMPKTSRMLLLKDASTAQLDQLDHPDLLESPVSVVCADLRATQDSQDVMDSQAAPEIKELQVPLVRTVIPEPLVRRVTMRRNQSDARDHVDLPARLDPKDLSEMPDRTVQSENPEHQDKREPQASRDQLESMARKDPKDLPESQERTPSTAHAPDVEVLARELVADLVLVVPTLLVVLVLAETTAADVSKTKRYVY
jgi:hypothetical protein